MGWCLNPGLRERFSIGPSGVWRKGVMVGWVMETINGQKYNKHLLDNCASGDCSYTVVLQDVDGFSRLTLEQTYFLIVEQSAKVARNEAHWRARMQKEREAA